MQARDFSLDPTKHDTSSKKQPKNKHLRNLEQDKVPGSPPHSVSLCPVSDHTKGAGPTSWHRWPSWRRSLWSWSPAGRLWRRPPVCRSQTPRRRCRVSPGPDGPLWNQETCAGQTRSRLNIASLCKREHTELEFWTHWLNSMDSIISLVSSGRLLRNRM